MAEIMENANSFKWRDFYNFKNLWPICIVYLRKMIDFLVSQYYAHQI